MSKHPSDYKSQAAKRSNLEGLGIYLIFISVCILIISATFQWKYEWNTPNTCMQIPFKLIADEALLYLKLMFYNFKLLNEAVCSRSLSGSSVKSQTLHAPPRVTIMRREMVDTECVLLVQGVAPGAGWVGPNDACYLTFAGARLQSPTWKWKRVILTLYPAFHAFVWNVRQYRQYLRPLFWKINREGIGLKRSWAKFRARQPNQKKKFAVHI